MTVLRVLGPLALDAAGHGIALGGDKQRTVLALLAAAEGRVVPTASLLEGLWEDAVTDKAHATLQVHVSNLRRALAAAGEGAPRVELVHDGYRLDLAATQLDLAQFRSHCAAASAARTRGDSEAASRLYADALGLWRGDAFADLSGVRAVREIAVALDEDRLVAVGRRIDADLDRGLHAELVSELSQLVRQHPLRERFWEQLMVALYRSGRQADALSAYAGVRRLLSDELGVDPGEPLQRLEAAVLAHDPALDGRHTVAGPRVSATLRADDLAVPDAQLLAPDGRAVRLGPGRLLIGRDPECALVVDDPKVSRRHAEVVGTPEGYLLNDLGSTNGSFVNGRSCRSQLLSSGDELTLGATTWTFALDPQPPGLPRR